MQGGLHERRRIVEVAALFAATLWMPCHGLDGGGRALQQAQRAGQVAVWVEQGADGGVHVLEHLASGGSSAYGGKASAGWWPPMLSFGEGA